MPTQKRYATTKVVVPAQSEWAVSITLDTDASDRAIATTKAVAKWPVPTCVRDVRAWLGLTGYYRRFVKGYAKISAPLTAFLAKGCKFVCSEEAQQSFVKLKEALTSPPILAMPAEEGLFTLDTDASDRWNSESGPRRGRERHCIWQQNPVQNSDELLCHEARASRDRPFLKIF